MYKKIRTGSDRAYIEECLTDERVTIETTNGDRVTASVWAVYWARYRSRRKYLHGLHIGNGPEEGPWNRYVCASSRATGIKQILDTEGNALFRNNMVGQKTNRTLVDLEKIAKAGKWHSENLEKLRARTLQSLPSSSNAPYS